MFLSIQFIEGFPIRGYSLSNDFLNTFLTFSYLLCACIYNSILWRSENNYENYFSPSPVGLPGVELMSSNLVVSTFTHWVVTRAPKQCPCINCYDNVIFIFSLLILLIISFNFFQNQIGPAYLGWVSVWL